MAERGKYIVLEGAEYVGKSTQARILAESINGGSEPEPGGTEFGERIRSILLDPEIAKTPVAQLLAHASARAELKAEVVKPLINQGIHFVGDRSWVSSAAYQSAQGVSLKDIITVNRIAIGDFMYPDLLIILDADPQKLHERSSTRAAKDYYEQHHSDFHNQVRQNYLDLGTKLGAVILDATASVEQVAEEIRQKVSDKLNI